MCRRIDPQDHFFVVVDVHSTVTVFPELYICEHLSRIVPKFLHIGVR